MSCDPLQLAEGYIARIREIQAQTERTFSAIPGTLGDLTQCLVFGTADRASSVLDPSVIGDAFSLDSLKRRVDTIFDSVETGLDQVGDQVSEYSSQDTVNFAVATSGLWLSQDPANTFFGLAAVRAERAAEDARKLAPLIETAQAASAAARTAIADLDGPQGQALLAAARLYVEEICPEVDLIRSELLEMSQQVAETRDLDRSRCGVPSLDARLRALLAKIPDVGMDQVMAAVEAVRRMREVANELETVRGALGAVQDEIPAFEDNLAAGGYATQTEQRLPRALADQFAEICEQIAALAERDRWAEMAGLGPQLKEIAAIAIVTLEQSPEWRVQSVRAHAAKEPFDEWAGGLRGAQRPASGAEAMDRVEGSLAASIIGLSDDILFAVEDYEQYLTDLAEYGQVIQDGAEAFLGLVDELIDQACVGALRVLLFEVGFEVLEDLYARGLFRDLPAAVYELSTQSGRLIRCVGDVLNGVSAVVPAEQRFALERANDVLRTLEDTDQQIAEVARELDGWLRQPPLTHINQIADALEVDLKGGLRDIGVTVPGLPKTAVSSDGFVQLLDDAVALPEGIVKDTAGFLRAEVGVPIPEGYTRQPNGYLISSALGL